MALRRLFLDMNSFFASVEQQEHPELRGKPVAVVPMLSDSTCCIAASYEAKAFGIRTGTNVGEARRLCPDLRLIEGKHGAYRAYHNQILTVVGGYLPIDKVMSVDEMVCRLWSNERRASDAIRLAEQIKAAIAARVGECLRCSVGLTLNPFLAKVAAELQKPNGLVRLDDDDMPHKLFELSLRDFPGIGRAMERRLCAAGVTTTEQMYALDCFQLRAIWGSVGGEIWWRLLRGEGIEEPPTIRRSVSHSHVLAPELRNRRAAAIVARRLLEKASERMRRLGYHARGLGVYARGEQRQRWERKARLTACSDTWTLMEKFHSLYEHPFDNPKQIAVVLYDLIADADITLPLFGEAEQRMRAIEAVDTINQRYGRGTITIASAFLPKHDLDDKIAFAKVQEMA